MSEHKPCHSLGEDICTECKGYEPWPCRDFLQAALAAAEARAAAAEAALRAEQEWRERNEALIRSNGVSFADWRAETWEIDRLMMRAQEMRRAVLAAGGTADGGEG